MCGVYEAVIIHIMEIRRKHMTRRVLPFNITQVIRNDTDRSATYDFLLVIHSNYGLSRTISKINGVSIKTHKFSHPVYTLPLLMWYALEFCIGGGIQNSKARKMPLPDGRKSLTCSFVYTRYQRSADRLTARQKL